MGVEGIFIQSKQGDIKTNCAISICNNMGYSYFICNDKYDLLADYREYDVVIINNVNLTDFTLEDYRGFTGNIQQNAFYYRGHTILGIKLVIVTSEHGLDYFANTLTNFSSNQHLFYRLYNTKFVLSGLTLKGYVYKEDIFKYTYIGCCNHNFKDKSKEELDKVKEKTKSYIELLQ